MRKAKKLTPGQKRLLNEMIDKYEQKYNPNYFYSNRMARMFLSMKSYVEEKL